LLGTVHAVFGAFTIYRMILKRPITAVEPSHYAPAMPRGSRVALSLAQRLMHRKNE
jgi:hypothetical protein